MVEMGPGLADTRGELRADRGVREKGDTDLRMDLGACKQTQREEIQCFGFRKTNFLRMKTCHRKCNL